MAIKTRSFLPLFKTWVINNKLTSALVLIGYLIPILTLIYFVSKFAVNVPFWDQWNLIALFEKNRTHQATFEDFLIQQNEHKMFFPKIIFVTFAFISRWNTKLEIYFSIFLALLTFLSDLSNYSNNPKSK